MTIQLAPLPIEYDIAIEGGGRSILIEWDKDTAKGWVERYQAELASAERLSLVPCAGVALPVVTVRLGEGRRWVLFSRVFGQINTGRQIRLYCLGWQSTVKGENVKSLLWVYPGGTVESAEEPSFVRKFFD